VWAASTHAKNTNLGGERKALKFRSGSDEVDFMDLLDIPSNHDLDESRKPSNPPSSLVLEAANS
jgi:hypothetical protein